MNNEPQPPGASEGSARPPLYPPPPPSARPGSFADARPRTNGLAVASLTMGLVALMIFPLIPLSALGGLLALVMGGVARRQIKRSDGAMSGAEMARFGLWLGLVAVLVALGLTIAAYVLDVEVINVDLST
ncbi:MAG: DUF4190 domain-containing protein [Actinomycetota bacterium]